MDNNLECVSFYYEHLREQTGRKAIVSWDVVSSTGGFVTFQLTGFSIHLHHVSHSGKF
jgi:hypothetical protein